MILAAATLETGAGAWHPLYWLAAFVAALVVTYVVRAAGERKYRPGTDQTKPFISGNEVPGEGYHIRAGNLYWGYLEALKEYYQRLVPIHSGIPTDYLLWLFGVMAAVLLIGLSI